MTSVDFEMHGWDEIHAKLERLNNPKTVKKIARKSARKAANIWRKQARQNAKKIDDPETREMIHKNIATKGGKSRRNAVRMRVGVRGGARLKVNFDNLRGGNTQYWRFIEFGNEYMPAVPFMRTALSQNIESATAEFTQIFKTELDKALLI